MEWHQYTKHEEGKGNRCRYRQRGGSKQQQQQQHFQVCAWMCVCVCARVSRYKRKWGIGASCTFVRLSGDVEAGDGFGGSGFFLSFYHVMSRLRHISSLINLASSSSSIYHGLVVFPVVLLDHLVVPIRFLALWYK